MDPVVEIELMLNELQALSGLWWANVVTADEVDQYKRSIVAKIRELKERS